MDERPFLEQARKPTAKTVATTLDGAARWYDELVRLGDGFTHEWNHAKASGWLLKVHDRKKALFYLVPLAGSFRVSLTVRPEERTALLKDPGIAALHQALHDAKKYSEGHALRFHVVDAASHAEVSALVERVVALRARPVKR